MPSDRRWHRTNAFNKQIWQLASPKWSFEHPQPEQYRAKFTGPYAHRLITGGIGHNLPQEAPAAFAQAVFDAAKLAR